MDVCIIQETFWTNEFAENCRKNGRDKPSYNVEHKTVEAQQSYQRSTLTFWVCINQKTVGLYY